MNMKVDKHSKKELILLNGGFTLVELLGVIVILSLLMLLVFPNVINLIKENENKNDEISEELIYNAVDTYISKNQDDYKKNYGNIYCVSVKDLVDSDLLKGNYDNEKSIKVTYTGKYNYEITSATECENEKKYITVDLYNSLTPVIYDGTKWIVADSTKKWYDYDNQEWANAVILKQGLKKSIGDQVTVEGNDPEALAMFVWIPRYEYKIDTTGGQYGKGSTNKATPGEIEVNFISKETTEPTNGYIIHPAFTFDDTQLSGIWVGKFETSHATLITSSSAQNKLSCTNNNCTNADGLRILPNVQSIQYNNASNFFYAGLSMTRATNPFGLDRTTTDSHMMKNSEWGAVAYLSQSKYGKYGNDDFKGAQKEVYINNSGGSSTGYYTGRSGGNVGGSTPIKETYSGQSSTTQYNTYGFYTYDGYLLTYGKNEKSTTREILKGTGASTTGNIYGVYDMSGGAMEYVMGYYTPAYTSGSSKIWGSASDGNYALFKSEPAKKYYDAYTTTTATTACNKGICYGHALSETTGWYGDSSDFVYSSKPWFRRGGSYSYGSNAGMFYFGYTAGGGNTDYSFHVVLSSATGA